MFKEVIGVLMVIGIVGVLGYVFIFTGNSLIHISGVDSSITNGGFETGTTEGWTTYENNGTIRVDTSAAHSGSYGANLSVFSEV